MPRHETVRHLTARDTALSAAFSELSQAHGVLPGEIGEDDTYLSAIKRQCVRELFGMLENWRGPRDTDWRDWPVKMDERESLAESLVLVGQTMRNVSTLRLHVAHLRKSNVGNGKKELQLMLSSQSVAFKDVLGSDNEVVAKTERKMARCADGDMIFCSVGSRVDGAYVGDFTSALTDACKSADRAPTPLFEALRHGGLRVRINWRPPLELGEPRPWACELNPSQHRALAGLKHNLELISGPPGTGKSTTILALVKECTPNGEQVILTAVQNRAIEALTEKFAASQTPIIVVGRRPTGISCEFTLDAQIDRDPEVMAAQLKHSRLTQVHAALVEQLYKHQAVIFSHEPKKASKRAQAREQLISVLIRNAISGRGEQSSAWSKSSFKDSRDYDAWQKDFFGRRQCTFAKRQLREIVNTHVRAQMLKAQWHALSLTHASPSCPIEGGAPRQPLGQDRKCDRA